MASAARRHRTWACALLALIGLSLVLNWWGTRVGLPDVWHPDEPRYVAGAWIISPGNMNPGTINNPLFFTYLLFAERGLIQGWFRLFGTKEGLSRFRDDAWPVFVGRLTVGAFMAAAVWLMFRIGATVAGRPTGLAAAALTATNFLLVRNSHFALNDIPLVFWILLSAERSAAYVRRAGPSKLWLAAISSGLAFATKYSGGMGLCFPMIAIVLCRRERSLLLTGLRLLVCGLLFTASALAANPYFVLDSGYHFRDFLFMMTSREKDCTIGMRTSTHWHQYIDMLMIANGAVGLLLAGLGMLVMALRRTKWAVLLFAVPMLYLAMLMRRTMAFPRYVLPVLPFLCLGAALAARQWAARRKAKRWLTVLTVVACIGPLARCIRHDVICTREDTRVQAKQWIEKHVPRYAEVVVEGNFPAMPSHPYMTYVGTRLLKYAHRVNPDHFVCDATVRKAWESNLAHERMALAGYRAIEQTCPVAAEFYPYRPGRRIRYHLCQSDSPLVDLWNMLRPGPPIRIYRLRPSEARPVDVPVKRKRPFTPADWVEIAREGIFPEGKLTVTPEPSRP